MSVARLAITFLSLGFFWAPSAFAQKEPEEPESEVSPQIWVDYNPSVLLTLKLDLFGDIGYRAEFPAP